MLIFNEHFHADRICKITDRKNDDRPFILDLTGIQTDDLTMKGNFSHFFHDLIQADRLIFKIPAIDEVRIISQLQWAYIIFLFKFLLLKFFSPA